MVSHVALACSAWCKRIVCNGGVPDAGRGLGGDNIAHEDFLWSCPRRFNVGLEFVGPISDIELWDKHGMGG